MNILIDIGHPAHVHIFRHMAILLQEKGHHILFTVRNKEYEVYLLNKFNLNFISFGKHYQNPVGKLYGLVKFNILLLGTALKFRPDIFLSHGSPYAAQVSWLLRKKHISLEDTFNFEQVRLYKPFTECILSGDYKHPDLGKKSINYSGYHELAYLYPDKFHPDEKIKEMLNISKNEKYTIIRFVSWNASHDIGHRGISEENKRRAVEEFSSLGRVFISSESELPFDLEKYRIQIPPEKMHDAIAFSSLFFGESATMASEAAVLGVPAIFLDNTGRYYTRELQEKYGLVSNYSESPEDQARAIARGVELLSDERTKEIWQGRKEKMIEDKINVTSFLTWFIEEYPKSLRIMKENPEYQKRFKI